MKKYIITSPKFNGEIHLLYASPESGSSLLLVDFLRAQLDDKAKEWFVQRIPVQFTDKFKEAFGNSPLTVMEHGYRITFDQWWERYGKKINKVRAEKLWNKLSEADQVNAFFKLPLYERFLALESWRTKSDPESYLRNRSWDNEWK